MDQEIEIKHLEASGTLVWACSENGRKQNSPKSIVYEFGINKTQEVDQEIDGNKK
jgi:hypothetical protein